MNSISDNRITAARHHAQTSTPTPAHAQAETGPAHGNAHTSDGPAHGNAHTSRGSATSAHGPADPGEPPLHSMQQKDVNNLASTWAPDGSGPYTLHVTDKSAKPETVTLTGNGQSPVSTTIAAGQSKTLDLPANFGGNIRASTDGSTNPSNPTLFEFHTGSGAGSNTSFDASTINGDNLPMTATAGGAVSASNSNAPGSHYTNPNSDQARPSPVKNTKGTSLSLEIG